MLMKEVIEKNPKKNSNLFFIFKGCTLSIYNIIDMFLL